MHAYVHSYIQIRALIKKHNSSPAPARAGEDSSATSMGVLRDPHRRCGSSLAVSRVLGVLRDRARPARHDRAAAPLCRKRRLDHVILSAWSKCLASFATARRPGRFPFWYRSRTIPAQCQDFDGSRSPAFSSALCGARGAELSSRLWRFSGFLVCPVRGTGDGMFENLFLGILGSSENCT